MSCKWNQFIIAEDIDGVFALKVTLTNFNSVEKIPAEPVVAVEYSMFGSALLTGNSYGIKYVWQVNAICEKYEADMLRALYFQCDYKRRTEAEFTGLKLYDLLHPITESEITRPYNTVIVGEETKSPKMLSYPDFSTPEPDDSVNFSLWTVYYATYKVFFTGSLTSEANGKYTNMGFTLYEVGAGL